MYYLQNNIEIVSGAKRFCIYDFNTKKMYSLDLDAKNILDRIINNDDAEELALGSDAGKYFLREGIIVDEPKLTPKIATPTFNFNVTFAWIEVTQLQSFMSTLL